MGTRRTATSARRSTTCATTRTRASGCREPQPLNDPPGEENDYFYEGRGVTAVIAPWNFPLAIITGMSVGALAGGNAAILKPAAQSPVIAHRLVELLHEAGVPRGVVQYLPGPGGEVGQALVEHPGVDNIAFTGSSGGRARDHRGGRRRRSPAQRNVKRVDRRDGRQERDHHRRRR